MTTPQPPLSEPVATGPLRTLRLASWAQGGTLLALLFIAVPLKRLADVPMAVTLMGPIHGAAFLAYAALVFSHLAARRINLGQTMQLMTAAFVPFGAFLVGSVFRHSANASANGSANANATVTMPANSAAKGASGTTPS